MNNMKGQNTLVMAIILIVSAVVGMSIINSIMTDAANTESSTQGTLNMSTLQTAGYLQLTPCQNGINALTAITVTGGALTENTNYSLDKSLCRIKNMTAVTPLINVTYDYSDTSTYSSSLSRTIAGYVVPIGLLAVLGMAVMVAL
jgi:hypothetical protein